MKRYVPGGKWSGYGSGSFRTRDILHTNQNFLSLFCIASQINFNWVWFILCCLLKKRYFPPIICHRSRSVGLIARQKVSSELEFYQHNRNRKAHFRVRQDEKNDFLIGLSVAAVRYGRWGLVGGYLMEHLRQFHFSKTFIRVFFITQTQSKRDRECNFLLIILHFRFME